MKKLTALVVISMFALAACQPLNLSASGETVDAAAEPLIDTPMETEDSNSDDSSGGETESSDSDSSEYSNAISTESSSESSDSQYSVDIWLEDGAIIPEALTLHEGSTINWTNNDSVSYTITIMKMDDSSDDSLDDSMDDSSDDSSNDDSYDDSYYATELTVEPGQTVTFTLPDSGTYQFTISGGLISLSGTITVSDSESDDSYDDMDDSMDDRYDDSEDDTYDDSSDDSYNDSSDDSYDDSSDDSYDDSDEYDDEEDDSEEDDSHSALFMIAI